MLDRLPVTQRRLQVAGASTVVLEAGDGPPLVLLHGGIECGGAIWAPVVPSLADSYRLVIPDLPGLGESEPVPRLDFSAFSHWLAELLERTCGEEPTLIAHSLGGSLAAHFAAQKSDLLQRLVIYAAPAIGQYRMPLGLRMVAIRFALRPTERNAERFDRWAFFDYDRARERNREWFEAFSGYTRSRAVVPHVKRTMRQLIGSCTKRIPDAELRRTAVATGLVWGRQDRFVPLSLAEAASARLEWPLQVVEESGHATHVERPEAFLNALRSALGAT